MGKMVYQNENAVLNHLGVRKVVNVTAKIPLEFQYYGTPGEIKDMVASIKKNGATNVKVK